MRVDYDAELQRHDRVLRAAWGVRPEDAVLDVGCGAGRTTRAAARAASAGSALGVDVSAAAIERARALARTEGVRNVAFECGDAQVFPFAAERFDLVVSRFGTMFFADPAGAFGNIRRALRPGGRLVMMVWQAAERNEWDLVIRGCLAPAGALPAPAGPDPFSLAEPAAVQGILRSAGFGGITLTEVREPVYYGPDVAAALEWAGGFASTTQALARLDPPAAARALDRLRQAFAAHLSEDGVWFDSRAWIVGAARD